MHFISIFFVDSRDASSMFLPTLSEVLSSVPPGPVTNPPIRRWAFYLGAAVASLQLFLAILYQLRLL